MIFSGGPVLVSHEDAQCVHNIVALTSYGMPKCGSKSASVYTKITAFLDWIEEKVWPN